MRNLNRLSTLVAVSLLLTGCPFASAPSRPEGRTCKLIQRADKSVYGYCTLNSNTADFVRKSLEQMIAEQSVAISLDDHVAEREWETDVLYWAGKHCK